MLKKVIKRSYILLELLIAITQVIYQLAQFKKAVSAHDIQLLSGLCTHNCALTVSGWGCSVNLKIHVVVYE